MDAMTPSLARPARPRTPALRFVRATSGERRDDALDGCVVLASSGGLGWDGVACEIGVTPHSEADDLSIAGHNVATNLGPEAVPFEFKVPGGYVDVLMPPGALWINPAGAPFTQRHHEPFRWSAFDISLEKVRRVLGRDLDLRPVAVLHDEPLAAVTGALGAQVSTGGSAGPLFADALLVALVSCLARLAGVTEAAMAPHGALGAGGLTRVKDRIEASLGEALRVGDLAAVAGLSPAHFAREFKRLTSESPHAYVMRRRVERARELFAVERSVAEVAMRCGFADQAHLTRLFRRRYGVGPGAFVRGAR